MATQTRLNVTLYVNGLSCHYLRLAKKPPQYIADLTEDRYKSICKSTMFKETNDGLVEIIQNP